MTDAEKVNFHFDLWTQPWIGLEKLDGEFVRLGIEDTLLGSHEFRGFFDPSPLVVVGIHRLLTAILQDIFSPESEEELKQLWTMQQLSAEMLTTFQTNYGDRFDLFSQKAPFFQSMDTSSTPAKGENIKSAAYLFHDIPSGTEHTHYRHGVQTDQIFCPVCVAAGMVTLPAFSTSGGKGIKPSINGVPPTYVIPCGKNLLESLLLSLVLPGYQPQMRSVDLDLAWWKREPLIPRSSEVVKVGYLHSLTFQPRRVRLYPEKFMGPCSRCGETISWGVREMIFDMGESRPKESPPWFDPFAAYKTPEKKPPIPIRPVEGKATWREYSSLFLKGRGQAQVLRPLFLDQIADLLEVDAGSISFRCVGMRTDMKAKIFEWVDTGFEVPGNLLRDEDAGYIIGEGIRYAGDCASTMASVFRKKFGGPGKDAARYAQLKTAMMDDYWKQLAIPFRRFVTETALVKGSEEPRKEWIDLVTNIAKRCFSKAAAAIGEEGKQLHERFSGERLCHNILLSARKKELNYE